jgi:hydroxylamine reductase
MFCYQCEQTAQCKGCTVQGVCGKTPENAGVQDLLIYTSKGIARYFWSAIQKGAKVDNEIVEYLYAALFTTVTNVNFDSERFVALFERAGEMKTKAQRLYKEAGGGENLDLEVALPASGKLVDYVAVTPKVGVMKPDSLNADIRSLRELLTYGLKGFAAYAYHAREYRKMDAEADKVFVECLAATGNDNAGLDELIGLNLKLGGANIKIMEIYQDGEVEKFGAPEPTPVQIGVSKGHCILVSGHDLLDLEALLKQTEGKGINVYTHGEMLPAHGYPGLKKYKHLVGNYGGAWQDQAQEFDAFPGSILMTTNCIQKPRDSYKNRLFTTSLVGWPGVAHVENRQYEKVIQAALAAPGFPADKPEKEILVGFSHQAVLKVADKIINAVKSKAIRHFFLIGGCDGAKSGRNYFTDFATNVPKDCVILTLACGKFRFNKLDFGTIGGIPRLLDIGQCNDANSAIKIAAALAGAFNCGVNDLPLSMIISWYEQKAVIILLSLLHLGIKNIRLGPTLPAWVTPNVLQVLVKNFNLMPIGTAESDLKAILG